MTQVKLNFRVIGFIGLSKWMLTNAYLSIDGVEKADWQTYYISTISQRAKELAAERGVTIGDIADEWNAELRKREEADMKTSPLPSFTLEFKGEGRSMFDDWSDDYMERMEAWANENLPTE